MIKLITNNQIKELPKNYNTGNRNKFLEDRNIYDTEDKPNKRRKYLFVKVNTSMVKVSYNEIKYIEGLKDYIKIYINDKPLITKSTIKHIESILPGENFTRVHKSYIIAIDKIDKIEYNHIFIGQKKIPIGMQFKDKFYGQIDNFKL